MMKIDKKELKLVSYDFRCKSNLILQSDSSDFSQRLKIFLNFIDSNGLISSLITSKINSNSVSLENIKNDIHQVSNGYGEYIFNFGITDDEQIAYIYQFLKHMDSENLSPTLFLYVFTDSRKYDDIVSAFNNKVTLLLINNIINYFTKMGYEMGYDEEKKFMIQIDNNSGQINISQDNSVLNASQNFTNDIAKIIELSETIKNIIPNDIDMEIKENISQHVEYLSEIIKTPQPNKSAIKICTNGLKNILPAITQFDELTDHINSLINKVINVFV